MSDVRVRFSAPVRPTEDPERVRRAALNLFPDAEVRVEEGRVSGEARGLQRIAELVANHRIPDTARNVMLRGRAEPDAAVTRFRMGKQAAFAGRPNFAPPDSALGDFEVEVEADSAEALEEALYRAAPDTRVDDALSRIPPSRRPPEGDAPPPA